jgi:hypothetical protein
VSKRRKEEGKKKGPVGPNGENSHGPHGLREKEEKKTSGLRDKIYMG